MRVCRTRLFLLFRTAISNIVVSSCLFFPCRSHCRSQWQTASQRPGAALAVSDAAIVMLNRWFLCFIFYVSMGCTKRRVPGCLWKSFTTSVFRKSKHKAECCLIVIIQEVSLRYYGDNIVRICVFFLSAFAVDVCSAHPGWFFFAEQGDAAGISGALRWAKIFVLFEIVDCRYASEPESGWDKGEDMKGNGVYPRALGGTAAEYGRLAPLL